MAGEVTLLVGTQNGAFALKSDRARRSWSVKGPFLPGWQVYEFSADTRGRRPVYYAGLSHMAFGTALHRSTDGGRNWTQLQDGPRYSKASGHALRAIWRVVPGPADSRETLYAGVADAGLFRSTDGGQGWKEVKGLQRHPSREAWNPGAGGLCLHTILQDPKDRRCMSIAISAAGFFATDDGGRTWDRRNEGLPTVIASRRPDAKKDTVTPMGGNSCVHCVVADPTKHSRLYMQNHQGFFVSSSGGRKWRRSESGLPSTFGFALAMHPHDPRTLFTVPLSTDYLRQPIKGRLQVYRSTDGAHHWRPYGKGLPRRNFYGGVLRSGLATDDRETPGLYLGTTNGHLFGSADEGKHWRSLPGSYSRILSVRAITA